METTNESLHIVEDIKRMMERSSRFISLSGWSGIAAGTCALVGSWMANNRLQDFLHKKQLFNNDCLSCLKNDLLLIAAGVFLSALVTAFFFTYLRSKKEGVAIWGTSAKRLLWNTILPMVAGGFVILRMMDLGIFEMIAPVSLIFYGLALVNGSKYTIGEVKYLGYAEIILGIVGLWFIGKGLLFWTIGFGFLHIIYGIWMWWKYERK